MSEIIEELLNNYNNHKNIGAEQMAQRIRTFVILAKALCLTPRAHMTVQNNL